MKSALVFLFVILISGASFGQSRCDVLASHPADPDRSAKGVSDDDLVPKLAIDACEREVASASAEDRGRLNFQLGRAYWLANKDDKAFWAFVAAVKDGYAPAMKMLGDAYSQGRGLPRGEVQSPDTALAWYNKARVAGFREADRAIVDTKKAVENATFRPEIFQNPEFMKRLYDGNFSNIENPILFYTYTSAMGTELGDNNIFMVNPKCKGMVTALGNFVNAAGQIMSYINGLMEPDWSKVIMSAGLSILAHDQGMRDAAILANTYECAGPITKRIVTNAIGSYDQLPQTMAGIDLSKIRKK